MPTDHTDNLAALRLERDAQLADVNSLAAELAAKKATLAAQRNSLDVLAGDLALLQAAIDEESEARHALKRAKAELQRVEKQISHLESASSLATATPLTEVEYATLRSMRQTYRGALEVARLQIVAIEAAARKRGGPTSFMGRTLVRLRATVTSLHFALCDTRNRLASRPPGSRLACRTLRVALPQPSADIPRSRWRCVPVKLTATAELQEAVAFVAAKWWEAGSQPFQLGALVDTARGMQRGLAIQQSGRMELAPTLIARQTHGRGIVDARGKALKA
jgi:hypothetical protein